MTYLLSFLAFQDPQVPSLYVLRGRNQGQRFYLNLPLVKLGRDQENDIQLNDSEVSRRHAQVVRRSNEFVFEDLNSANGSIINNEVVKQRVLANGDHIQVGRSLLLYTAKAPSSASVHPNVKVTGDQSDDDAALPDSISRIWKPQSRTDSEGHPISLDGNLDGHLNVMYQTALAVSHTLDVDQLLVRIMELILEWVRADRGCIFLLDPDTDQPVAKVARYRQSRKTEAIKVSRTILDHVLETEEGVLTSNAADDDRWNDADSVMRMGIREAICVPMQGRYGIVGAIYVDTTVPLAEEATAVANAEEVFGKRFKKSHLQLMVAIGNQSGIAIEDTTFYSGLVQSERLAAIGQTIAVMSHHIKNILQGFQGGGYLLEQGIKQQKFETIEKGWNVLQRNQDRVFNLVMDMLSYSKDREPRLEAGNLSELISDIVETVKGKADRFQVTLKWQAVPDFPQMLYDHESIHRAVLNVVSNAIDAAKESETPEVVIGLELSAAAETGQGRANIRVIDQGPGIEPEDVEKIFSLFESSKGGRGTGLGLPVSKKIMQEHEGDIEVRSVVGQHTEFVLWLPFSGPVNSNYATLAR